MWEIRNLKRGRWKKWEKVNILCKMIAEQSWENFSELFKPGSPPKARPFPVNVHIDLCPRSYFDNATFFWFVSMTWMQATSPGTHSHMSLSSVYSISLLHFLTLNYKCVLSEKVLRICWNPMKLIQCSLLQADSPIYLREWSIKISWWMGYCEVVFNKQLCLFLGGISGPLLWGFVLWHKVRSHDLKIYIKFYNKIILIGNVQNPEISF